MIFKKISCFSILYFFTNKFKTCSYNSFKLHVFNIPIVNKNNANSPFNFFIILDTVHRLYDLNISQYCFNKIQMLFISQIFTSKRKQQYLTTCKPQSNVIK